MPRPVSGNSVVGTSGDDYLDDIIGFSADYTIDGRAGNDTIFGGNGHDRLIGGRGDDLIYASPEDTIVDGGGGLDTVNFLYSATGVIAVLLDGALGQWPDTNPTTVRSGVLRNIENVTGSNDDDFIAGSRRTANELDGGGGNDRLQAYGSGDFLTGGTGADIFDVRPVIGSGRSGTDTVTVTDFQYNDGDRIDAGPVTPAQLDWVFGSATDADGNSQPAWIGTWHIPSEATFVLVVLGADTNPNLVDWFI
jgi:Ca2+-binding RTX toxin-like protein